MVYGDFKGLLRRTVSGKVLHDKAFNIVKNPNHDGNQRGLASVIYHFYDKKSFGDVLKSEIMSNQQLAENYARHFTKIWKAKSILILSR